MVLTDILKRKDAASVLIAVVLALIIFQPLPDLVAELSATLSGTDDVLPEADWRERYLQPVVSALLQIVLLEVVVRLFVALRGSLGGSRR